MNIEYVRFKVDASLQDDFITTMKQATVLFKEFDKTLGVEFLQNVDDRALFIWRVEWSSEKMYFDLFIDNKLYDDFHRLVEPYLFMILEMNHYQKL